MNETILIPIPKESVSDDSVLLSRWIVRDGSPVKKGMVIAVIETSKNTVDIESPADGFVHHLKAEDQRVPVGENFAAISSSAIRPIVSVEVARAGPVVVSGMEARFSKAALKLVFERKVDLSKFAHLALVRREDVEGYLDRVEGALSLGAPSFPLPQSNDIVLWGGGGHAKVCIEIIRAMGVFSLYGILDSGLSCGSEVLGVPVLASDSFLEEVREKGVCYAALGVGAVMSHSSRSIMLRRLVKAGYKLPNLVHPRAVVDPSARLGVGNVIFANSTISADVSIGDGCIVNSGAVVSHDCKLGDNVHLAPGSLLAGSVKVLDDTLIGMAASVFLGAQVGRGVRINNGAVVEGRVADGAVVRR